MDIAFDPEKNAANIRKHGLALAFGLLVLQHSLGGWVDDRLDYGEVRRNEIGLVNGRLFVCTYTLRGDTYRMISVRSASRQERRLWLS